MSASSRSRARRSNDNALVEGKNAHVVRRHLSHDHMGARDVDAFARRHLSSFVNFRRPSLYAPRFGDSKGQGAAQVTARRRQDAV